MTRLLGVGLHVRELDRSVDFYSTVLGLIEVARHESDSVTEAVLGSQVSPGSASLMLLGGATPAESGATNDAFNKIVFAVEDIQSTCQQFEAWGCVIERAPTDLPEHGVATALALDPDGHRVELVQLRGIDL